MQFRQLEGRYEIVRLIDRGGMGEVHLARDLRVMEREVAVKILPLHFLADEEIRSRFEREARVIIALEHPAIVPIYDYGEYERHLFLVMRYMRGGSLAHRIRSGNRFSLSFTFQVLERVGQALESTHQRGIVHRDIKPSNILLDEYDTPYLCDFGIAKVQKREQTSEGEASTMIGTPAYMSPEQSQGLPVTGSSDVYALGVVLFEMLTGYQPYRAETPHGLAWKHINAPIPRLADLVPEIPADCQTIVDRAMAKDPSQRYPYVMALVRDFARLVPADAGRAAAEQATVHDPRLAERPEPEAADVDSTPDTGKQRRQTTTTPVVGWRPIPGLELPADEAADEALRAQRSAWQQLDEEDE